jgi:hypothetical protein
MIFALKTLFILKISRYYKLHIILKDITSYKNFTNLTGRQQWQSGANLIKVLVAYLGA